MDEHVELIREALADRYTFDRAIGRGGMATVYLAEERRPQRQVAIKVMEPALGDGPGRDRFLREVQIVSQLTHPHIVPIFAAGEVEGLLYYVMPFIAGQSLRVRLARRQSLTLEDVLRVTQEVADALEYAHGRGIVHRDIKPANILLEAEHAVVTDFGIARALSTAYGAELRLVGVPIGTPGYMSPEQLSGSGEIDRRSDIYSLACVLYEMLHGNPPTLLADRHSQPDARRGEHVDDGDRKLDAVEHVLWKALEWAPENRQGSAAEFAAALGDANRPSCSTSADPCSREGPPWVPQKSVAVLPFANMSADPENEYFSDGITDDIITQLSRARGLKVTSRTSAMRYKNVDKTLGAIGGELGVATILEGSVRRAGNRVRITAQLIDVQTDTHLWAETYDRDLTDIFEIQSDVARQIAHSLEAALSPASVGVGRRKPTEDFAAYDLYLKGLYYCDQHGAAGGEKALECFEGAIDLDPEFALAHAGLANVYLLWGAGLEGSQMPPDETFQFAREAARRALEIDPALADAYATLASVHFWHEWDWAAASAAFARANDLSGCCDAPHVKYGFYLAALGRYDEAIARVRQAIEYDPLSLRVHAHLAEQYFWAGRFGQAADQALKTLDLNQTFAPARLQLGLAQLRLGRVDDAVSELEQAVGSADKVPDHLAALGCAYGVAGRADEAHGVLEKLAGLSDVQYVPQHTIASVWAWLGESEVALDWLESAFKGRDVAMPLINTHPSWDPVRKEPRFAALVEKMNFPAIGNTALRSARLESESVASGSAAPGRHATPSDVTRGTG